VTESEIAVREAAPADAEEIAALGARTFYSTYASNNTPENIDAYISDSFNTETIVSELEDPRSVFLLVVRDNLNIGFAKVIKSETPDCVDGPDPIELERIYVDASHQGGGIGAKLMQAVMDYARGEGCGCVWLGVWEKNTAARGFYERQGFTLVGTKTFTVGEDEQNDVVMSRTLD
jgi:ribosomal protein S18 acetylase RimI-like enzyme